MIVAISWFSPRSLGGVETIELEGYAAVTTSGNEVNGLILDYFDSSLALTMLTTIFEAVYSLFVSDYSYSKF